MHPPATRGYVTSKELQKFEGVWVMVYGENDGSRSIK
jgi:hypothetical protein